MSRSRHHATTSSYLGPVHVGSLNADPMAPRKDFGENGSLVFLVAITPVAPAASAVRRIAPTLTGLLIWWSTTSSGLAARLAAKCASEESGRAARTTIPCGVFV